MATNIRFDAKHGYQCVRGVLHRAQTCHLVGIRIGRDVTKVLLDRITPLTVDVVDAVIHEHRSLAFIVKDEHPATEDVNLFRSLMEHIAGKPSNELVIQTPAYRAKTLVVGGNVLK